MILKKSILIFIVCFFLLSVEVKADIGDGINGGNKAYVWKDALLYSGKKYASTGAYGLVYSLKNNLNDVAYCLDPGLISPNNDGYNYYRELDLSTTLDQNYYKAYKYYVNNITAMTAGGSKQDIQKKNDAILRIITGNAGYNASISSAARDNQYFGENGIAEYIKGNIEFKDINWALGGNTQNESQNCYYWTNSYDVGTCETIFKGVKTYYENFNNYNKGCALWENKITITPSVKYVNDSEPYYVFNFEVDFNNDGKNFFDCADYNNGYDMDGYFSYSLGDFNDYYSISGHSFEYSNPDTINKDSILNDGKINIYAKVKASMYNAIKNNDPKGHNSVFIKLNYEYYHPLSSENVFLNSKVDTINNSTNYQRMMIYTNYIHKDNIIASESDVVVSNTCEHKSDGTFIGKYGDSLDIENFESQCDCNNINESYLNTNIEKQFYNERCKSEKTISLTNNMEDCTKEEASENYQIEYSTTSSINEYCTLSCVETIYLNDLYGKYTVKAGQYFKLGKYPTLTGNKKCNVNVDFSTWESNYIDKLKDVVDYYNKWQDYKNTTESTTSCCTSYECSCGFFSLSNSCCCSSTKYTYSGSYYAASSSGVNASISTIGTSISTTSPGCGKGSAFSTKPLSQLIAESKEDYEAALTDLKKLQSELSSCATKLSGPTNNITDEMFYAFNQGIKFYYQRTYKKHGEKWNYERNAYNSIDDSDFFSTLISSSSSKKAGYEGNYNLPKNYGYDSIELDDISSSSGSVKKELIGIGDETTIERYVEYEYTYTPFYKKYVNAYTSEIYSNPSSLENPIELGYVYDIDISAIPKEENRNYFEFTALGDKNEIYNLFKNNSIVKYNNVENTTLSIEALKRYCDYEITSDLTSCKGEDCKLNVVFRSVDPANIDPNQRLIDSSGNLISYDGTNGFKNWRNENAQVVLKKIEDDAKSKNTYSPQNLEYSFTLDSKTLQAIREDNINYKYDDWNGNLYKCEDGNECKSDFISNAYGKGGISGTSTGSVGIKFGNGSNIIGRYKWKTISGPIGTKYTIDGVEVILNS